LGGDRSVWSNDGLILRQGKNKVLGGKPALAFSVTNFTLTHHRMGTPNNGSKYMGLRVVDRSNTKGH
jgi:hypothetical protein